MTGAEVETWDEDPPDELRDDWGDPDNNPPGTPAAVGPVARAMSTIDPERVHWVWPGRLAAGKLVVLDGDPGAGKSTMALDIAAAVTTGSPFPDGHRPEVGDVVLMSAEDGPGDTIRPRLDAAGGDPSRVHLFESVRELDPDDPDRLRERPPSIPRDIAHVEALVARTGAVLVVVDVLSAFLASSVDSYRDQDVRGALMPLAKMAERAGCCVVVIRHLTKGGGAKALYRGQGSIGIVGAARVGLIAATDPEDDSRRILAVSKSNLAALPESIAYRLVSDEEHGCGRIQWEGTTNHRADDLVSDRHEDPDDDQADAARVLESILADGPMWAKDVIDEMGRAGFSKDQAKRAKARLKATSAKHGKPGDAEQGWKWALPGLTEERTEGCEEGALSEPAPFAPLALSSMDEGGAT